MIKFVLSVAITIWMLVDAYKWMRRDWRDFEPKIVLKGFVLALILLFYDQFFSPTTELPKLTIFVKQADEKIPEVLINKVKIIAFYNHKSDTKYIGENGVVAFDVIVPPKNDTIYFSISGTEDYKLKESKIKYIGEPITLHLITNCRFCKISGIVQKQDSFISNAIVCTGRYSDTTDDKGYFEINIPPAEEQSEYPMTVMINGKIVKRFFNTPNPIKPADILIDK